MLWVSILMNEWCFVGFFFCLSEFVRVRVWHRRGKKCSIYKETTVKKRWTKGRLVARVMKETWSLASRAGEPLMCFTHPAKSIAAERWTLNFNSLHPQGTRRYPQTSTPPPSHFNSKQGGKKKKKANAAEVYGGKHDRNEGCRRLMGDSQGEERVAVIEKIKIPQKANKREIYCSLSFLEKQASSWA